MANTPKRIKFEDIRPGDKIRVVDVLDIEVKRHDGHEIWAGPHSVMRILETRANWPTSERKFQLLERATAPLPTDIGSAIKLRGDVWFLTAEPLAAGAMWHNTYSAQILSKVAMANEVRDAGGFEVVN